MKLPELDELQIEQLLEMVKALFPEGDWCTYDSNNDRGAPKYYHQLQVFQDDNYEGMYEPLTIHWFELCIYHLPGKLKMSRAARATYMDKVITNKIHPIEYLYQIFKS